MQLIKIVTLFDADWCSGEDCARAPRPRRPHQPLDFDAVLRSIDGDQMIDRRHPRQHPDGAERMDIGGLSRCGRRDFRH